MTGVSLPRYQAEETSDAQLVEAVLDGDSAAFTTLVERHSRACLRFATRMLGNVQDAEDVAQETFLRAYRALARYDGRTAFRTWLMSILINRCRSARRLRWRREAVVVADAELLAAVPHAAADGDVVLRAAIGRAVARLEPAQREAFLLRHVEQLSYEEMSAATGAGVSALKMRVQRACDRLRQLLEDERNA